VDVGGDVAVGLKVDDATTVTKVKRWLDVSVAVT
jgi:hypothetical protein